MDYNKIAEQLEVHKADRTRLFKAYPNLYELKTVDGQMDAWINYEHIVHLTGQINALEFILGMKFTFGNEEY